MNNKYDKDIIKCLVNDKNNITNVTKLYINYLTFYSFTYKNNSLIFVIGIRDGKHYYALCNNSKTYFYYQSKTKDVVFKQFSSGSIAL